LDLYFNLFIPFQFGTTKYDIYVFRKRRSIAGDNNGQNTEINHNNNNSNSNNNGNDDDDDDDDDDKNYYYRDRDWEQEQHRQLMDGNANNME